MNREIRLRDLKVCGGSLEWEEFREARRRHLLDCLEEVFDPESASNREIAGRRETQTRQRGK